MDKRFFKRLLALMLCGCLLATVPMAAFATEEAPALSTCSTEFTDARTIILAVMEPNQTANQEEK